MAKRYRDLSADEKTRYWEVFHQTCDTLRFAIIDLMVAAAEAERSSTASVILAEKLRLESELGLLESHSTAIVASAAAIIPPSAEDVANVMKLARQVDVMTANAETFRSVLTLAKNALETYGKVRGV